MSTYITITGQKHYFGLLPFSVDSIFSLKPEPDNQYDPYAIAVYTETYGKVGYVAQSPENRADGTVSASSLFSALKLPEKAIVRFIAGAFIIAELLEV
ncbi:MAG: DNA-binding protein [Ruminococcaceae bacterium]|nr:DNA-binding protein [Oscillospiraceae bacterium]